jgi:hypothetical protein
MAWQQKLYQSIDDCRKIVTLYTPEYIESKLVRKNTILLRCYIVQGKMRFSSQCYSIPQYFYPIWENGSILMFAKAIKKLFGRLALNLCVHYQNIKLNAFSRIIIGGSIVNIILNIHLSNDINYIRNSSNAKGGNLHALFSIE